MKGADLVRIIKWGIIVLFSLLVSAGFSFLPKGLIPTGFVPKGERPAAVAPKNPGGTSIVFEVNGIPRGAERLFFEYWTYEETIRRRQIDFKPGADKAQIVEPYPDALLPAMWLRFRWLAEVKGELLEVSSGERLVQRDPDHTWSYKRLARASVYFTDQRLAPRVAQVDQIYDRALKELGLDDYDVEVQMYFFPDRDSYLKLTNSPDWSGGSSDMTSTVFLPPPGDDSLFSPTTVAHELTHTFLPNGLPLWLEEGFTEYVASRLEPREGLRWLYLIQDIKRRDGEIIPFRYDVSRENQDVGDVYAVGFTYLDYLSREYGTVKLKKLVNGLKAAGYKETAFIDAFGKPNLELFGDFNKYLDSPRFQEAVRSLEQKASQQN